MNIEQLARKLGVWHRASWGSGGPPWRITPTASGLEIVHEGGKETRVDPLTAALLLLGHARGLRVDVGECPACRARGSKRGLAMWEWSQHMKKGGRRETLAAAHGFAGWDARFHGVGPTEQRRWIARRPCPTCTIDGAPTGRHTLTWEAAIVAAMPHDLGYDARRYASEEHAQRDAEALARLTKRDMSRYAVKRDAGVWRLHVIEPGDAPTREALAVSADAMQARGDVLGDFVTAWLGGDCPACKGSGWLGGRVRCWTCHSTGTVLGSFAPAIAEQVASAIESEAA